MENNYNNIRFISLSGEPIFGFPEDQNRTAMPTELIRKAYTNPYVFAVINRISNTAKNLNLKYEDGSTKIEELLTKQLLAEVYSSLLLFGEAYVVKIKGVGSEKTDELRLLKRQYLTIEYDSVNVWRPVTKYRYETQTYSEDDVIKILLPNIYSEYEEGLSPLIGAKILWEVLEYIDKFESGIYKNRGVMGVLSGVGDNIITPNDRKVLQSDWQNETAGVDNAGKIRINTGEVKYTPLSFKPSEMTNSESHLQKLRSICNLYNVDSALFNDPAASTYNNVHEAMKAFYTQAVLPLAGHVLETFSGEFNTKITFDTSTIEALAEDLFEAARIEKVRQESRNIFLAGIGTELELKTLTTNEAKKKIKEYDIKNKFIDEPE